MAYYYFNNGGSYGGREYFYVFEGTNGGHGSFNYGDPSKYGQRGLKGIESIISLGPKVNPFSLKPGAGGGARPTPLAKHGSHASGYSPNGIVIVRLSKVVS